MSGILFGVDGSYETVNFGHKFENALMYYINDGIQFVLDAPELSDRIDIHDISLYERDDGFFEHVVCIVDKFANELNPILSGFLEDTVCYGKILVVKTVSKSLSSFGSDLLSGVVKEMIMDVSEILDIFEKFHSAINEFLEGKTVSTCRDVYKVRSFVKSVTEKEDTLEVNLTKPLLPYFHVTFVDGSDDMSFFLGTSQGATNIPNNRVHMDMLTFKIKARGLKAHTYRFEECYVLKNPKGFSRIERAINNQGEKRICVICKGPTRWSCGLCHTYYSCGSSDCHSDAWEVHKDKCF